ncbi:MAG: hypothetical protein F6K65_05915 [Moorea sp. SIO3C2]|uniref:Uncharacterized protein n=1 Tax=Moorena producens (strain JHB) TaxID=1454205 RepID=A0A1D9FUJ0_MOOP1|nr:hypothetical protein [Moorena producens]AOY79046.1 hypothetical protein BJP36_03110 [Moorena producens JHB]NEP48383.1 hypothetical protein [Moorena sp. SIO3C2]NES86163.1 hypothetical protein [Moorena sp. SIO2B7]
MPAKAKALEKVAKKLGFQKVRQKGSQSLDRRSRFRQSRRSANANAPIQNYQFKIKKYPINEFGGLYP